MRLFADATVLFSLREAAVLSRLPEDKVRREVERKLIKPRMMGTGSAHRLLFAESEILYFAMLHSLSGTVELSPPVRATACRLLNDWEPVRLRRTKSTPVGPRVDLYREGLKRISEDDDVLDGEPVFKGTRLAVRHIGGMRARNEQVARIIEDYPELTPDDVEFARLYAEAHPLVGRPKSGAANRCD